MNKKILLTILIVALAVILFISIKTVMDINDSDNSILEKAGKVTGNITYKIHNNYNEGKFDYSKRGYYINTLKMPDSPWFYIISMGERSSGGYSIEISEVKIDGDNVKVIVEESGPKSRWYSNYGIYLSKSMYRAE